MKQPVVIAWFGDARSAAQLAEISAAFDVIAVVFDLGGPVSLVELRDTALAAGAIRCHAFDIREEFAREVLRRQSPSSAPLDPETAAVHTALRIVRRKLDEVASFEGAACVRPEHALLPARPRAKRVIPAAYLEIRFDNDLPVAINGVEMSLTELIESIETITGEPALAVVRRYRDRSTLRHCDLDTSQGDGTKSPDLQIA